MFIGKLLDISIMGGYNFSIPKIFMGIAISPTYAKIECDFTTAFP